MRVAPASLLVLLAPLAHPQSVLVVDDDGGPGVDYTSIQAAAAGAPSGSIVLVRDGIYVGDVVIDGKSLTLVAEGSANVMMDQNIVSIENLLPDQTVRIVGIDFTVGIGFTPSFSILNNQGPVWVEGMELVDLGVTNPFTGQEAVRIQGSTTVVFLDCDITANDGAIVGPYGPAGISVDDSSLYLYGCDVTGGTPTVASTTGGAGIHVDEGFVFAAHSRLTGGGGAQGGNVFNCQNGGDGGAGILLETAGATARLYDTVLTGGTGGIPIPPNSGGCLDGAQGTPSLVLSGALTEAPLALHDLTGPSLARLGEPVTLTFEGEPAETAWLLFGGSPSGLFLPTVSGSLLLDAPFLSVQAGRLGGGGTLDYTIPSPLLPIGLDGLVWTMQSFFLDSRAGFRFGPATALVVVAPVF